MPRLYRKVRGRADYRRSLDLLGARQAAGRRGIVTKSGLMLGIGETVDELFDVLADLRAVGCDVLTLGQYLAPTLKHIPVARFVPPAEFDAPRGAGPDAGVPASGRRAVRALQLPRRRDGPGGAHDPRPVPVAGRHGRHREIDPVPAAGRMAATPGVSAVACADPGGTPVGDQLRQILLASGADISDRAEALLFMASRAELVARVMRPALEAGRVVVCDRFVMANVAYQGHAAGFPRTSCGPSAGSRPAAYSPT